MNSNPSDQNDNYQQNVKTICQKLEEIHPENQELSETTDLTTDVHLDSASTMDLIFSLEETFDISVPLNDLGDLRTVGDLAKVLQKLQQQSE